MRLRLALIGAFCWLSTATQVNAADWEFAGFLGAVSTRPNTLTLLQPELGTHVSFGPVHYHSRSFTPPIYYGFRVTWFSRRDFGLGGEFFHAKAYARTEAMVRASGSVAGSSLSATVPLDSIVERFSMSHGLNFLLANAVFRHPLDRGSRPRVWLSGRAGAGVTIPHAESEIGGRSQDQYERGALGLQIGFEGECRVTKQLYALAQYKVTTTAESVAVVGGSMKGRFTSQHAVFGIAWHLWAAP
jgi:hypothetical protein